MFSRNFAVAALVGALAVPAAAVTVTYGNPGAETTTNSGTFAVETFESATAGFSTSFTDTIGGVTFAYTNVDIRPADMFGGAGGTGQYAATYDRILPGSADVYTLNVTSTGGPINYFGAYFSAENFDNSASFYKGGTLIYTFTPALTLAAIGSNPAYYGNPDAPFTGQDGREVFSFANIYFTGGQTYDRVVFTQPSYGGFETDNHTVGTFAAPITGNTLPEPGSWVLLIAGFGLVGAGLRRRRTAIVAA